LRKRGYRRIRLIIAGEGTAKRKLMELTSQLRLKQSVTFSGFVTENEKRELLNIADLYILASEAEGQPFSLMEAMACGCVCIASNVGDIPRLIDTHTNGFLVLPRDPQMLAAKIEEVIRLSKAKTLAIRRRARQTIIEKFDFRMSTRTMIDMIEKSLCARDRS
jgi:colanic acid/amylovoran biosynthesis glycosyltransferase